MNHYRTPVPEQRTTPRLVKPGKRSRFFQITWAERVSGDRKWRTRHRSTGEVDRISAQRVFNEFLGGFVQPRPVEGRTRFAALAETYLQEHCARRSANLARTQRSALRAPLLAFGEREPADITATVWAKYADARRGGQYAGQRSGRVTDVTIRREMGAASAVLNWCVRNGKLNSGDVHPMALPEPGQPREVWLDEAELQAVLDAADKTAPPDVRTAIYLFAYTGARREAVVTLRAGQIDFSQAPGKIDFRATGERHGRKRRAVVPIGKVLRPVLEAALVGLGPEDRVVTKSPMGTWASRFRAWADSQGFPTLTPHVFRHTFITLRFRAGVDPWKISGVVNEDLRTLLRVYGHHRPDHLTDAIDF